MHISINKEDAELLFRRYGAGIQTENGIVLHPFEVIYFFEKGKLKLKESPESIMENLKKEDELASEKYAIFKDLRINGYICKPSFENENWMRVFRKGFRPGEDRTQFLIKVILSQETLTTDSIITDIKKAAEVRKELVYSFVKKNKVFFLKISRTSFE
ncbi:hypothetical protein KJ780_03545 [Candidatus Micrarchaeota archaeon]|nr:hypothetical protein [Candidatus Micrarchaeota archaeon]